MSFGAIIVGSLPKYASIKQVGVTFTTMIGGRECLFLVKAKGSDFYGMPWIDKSLSHPESDTQLASDAMTIQTDSCLQIDKKNFSHCKEVAIELTSTSARKVYLVRAPAIDISYLRMSCDYTFVDLQDCKNHVLKTSYSDVDNWYYAPDVYGNRINISRNSMRCIKRQLDSGFFGRNDLNWTVSMYYGSSKVIQQLDAKPASVPIPVRVPTPVAVPAGAIGIYAGMPFRVAVIPTPPPVAPVVIAVRPAWESDTARAYGLRAKGW